jgi:type V secretory pathway adhesin AidA
MLPQNTRESALRREEFHQTLRTWLDESFDDRVGDSDGHAGPAWLWVRHGGSHFHLNAGSTRTGVRQYLRVVAENGGDAHWSTQDGLLDRVAVGPDRQVIAGFDFYRYAAGR